VRLEFRKQKLGNLFLPIDYCSRDTVRFFDDFTEAGDGLVWQPDVYEVAETLSRLEGWRQVVDIGCGSGAKLLRMSGEIETIGFDHPQTYQRLKNDFPTKTWFPINLDEGGQLHGRRRRAFTDGVVVCSDVIEHLLNPQYLLHLLKVVLPRVRCILVSTPDRIRNWGGDHLGPPPNPAHVREWSLHEFNCLLDSVGLAPCNIGYTINNDRDREPSTILAVIRGKKSKLSIDDYSNVFYSYALPS